MQYHNSDGIMAASYVMGRQDIATACTTTCCRCRCRPWNLVTSYLDVACLMRLVVAQVRRGEEGGEAWEGFDMVEDPQTYPGRVRELARSYLLPQGFPGSVAPQYATYMVGTHLQSLGVVYSWVHCCCCMLR